MYETTPREIARILKKDLETFDNAIRYAERIAQSNGESAGKYAAAAEILRKAQMVEDHAITFGVDKRACHRCGRPLDSFTAYDDKWFIDSQVLIDASNPNQSHIVSEIYCPDCW